MLRFKFQMNSIGLGYQITHRPTQTRIAYLNYFLRCLAVLKLTAVDINSKVCNVSPRMHESRNLVLQDFAASLADAAKTPSLREQSRRESHFWRAWITGYIETISIKSRATAS